MLKWIEYCNDVTGIVELINGMCGSEVMVQIIVGKIGHGPDEEELVRWVPQFGPEMDGTIKAESVGAAKVAAETALAAWLASAGLRVDGECVWTPIPLDPIDGTERCIVGCSGSLRGTARYFRGYTHCPFCGNRITLKEADHAA